MTKAEIKNLLNSPVAYHRIFAKIGGGAAAGLMLSQAWYWRDKGDGGWFWKTEKEWEDETGLTRSEQETARRHLRQRGLLEEMKRGMPAKLFYRVNEDAIAAAITAVNNTECGKAADKNAEIPQTGLQDAGIPQTRMQESRKQVWAKAADKDAGIPQAIKGTENTTEITSETTPKTSAAAEPPARSKPTSVFCGKCKQAVTINYRNDPPIAYCSKCKADALNKSPPGKSMPKQYVLPNDEFTAIFIEAYVKEYNLSYIANGGDCKQYSDLRRNREGELTLDNWAQAVANFFLTPRKDHRMTELCSSFAGFYKHPVDGYERPANGRTRPKTQAEINRGGTGKAVF